MASPDRHARRSPITPLTQAFEAPTSMPGQPTRCPRRRTRLRADRHRSGPQRSSQLRQAPADEHTEPEQGRPEHSVANHIGGQTERRTEAPDHTGARRLCFARHCLCDCRRTHHGRCCRLKGRPATTRRRRAAWSAHSPHCGNKPTVSSCSRQWRSACSHSASLD